jgi:chloramphenicol O-acetyltransferase type A
MKYIDIESWNRKMHFEFFYRMDYPQYNVCMDLDITRFLKFTKVHNLSFYYATIYAVTVAANKVENFKYRIRDGKVVLHDITHPSFTDMDRNSNDDLFKMITVEIQDNIFDFVKDAVETSLSQTEYINLEKLRGRDDLIYITCLPWISFTHVSHTISLNRNDSVPRISWGKYYKKEDKIMLPFSVQLNHALADGYHIGKYIEILQNYLNEDHPEV